jgi:hypothetical protein
MTRVPEDRFRLISGEESLAPYQFNTRVAKHSFCRVCGIYPFHRPRMAPELEGVDPLSLKVEVADGASSSVVEQGRARPAHVLAPPGV